MKASILAFVVALLALPSCQDAPPEPPPAPPPVAVAQPAFKPPPPYDFPIEDHAMKALRVFEVLSIDITYVFALNTPRAVFEAIEAEEPEETVFDQRHAPEFLDLHPARVTAMGLDPDKPVGLAMYGQLKKPTESSVWAVFGTLADEAVFREAFTLGKRDSQGRYPTQTADRRIFLVLENDEVVIASQPDALGLDGKTLAADPTFSKLHQALDYGAIASAYFNIKRGRAYYGIGLDEVGLGVKVFADNELQAGTVRIKFAELPASMNAQLPYLERTANLAAELHPTGRRLRAEIEKLEDKPRRRRAAAAKEMLENFEEVGALNTQIDSHFIAGRVWSLTRADVVKAYAAWVDLGPTMVELAQIADHTTAIGSVEVASDIDQDALGRDLAATAKEFGSKDVGGISGTLTKFGGILGGGGGGGGGGKSAGGMLSNLGGGMGGMFGGATANSDITVSSSNSRLKSHVSAKLQSLAVCWARLHAGESFTVIANVEIAPASGQLKVTRLRNVPKGMDSCVRGAFVGSIKPTPPKPTSTTNGPPEAPKPEKVTVKLVFDSGK